jgi:4-amino-4-deoxy-L-arabinose transferase-like glycosyltransferase
LLHVVTLNGDRASSIAAAVLAVAVAAVGLGWGSTTVGGADSYGYVSQADLFLEGRLIEPAPWIGQVPWPGAQHSFTPLGWVPRRAEPVVVPQYAPGLPLIMAGAKAIAGHCAVFWIVPLAGGLVVWATFAVGRRLVSGGAGLMAAVLVAASPAFLFMLLSPMSDVPVTAAWALSFLALTGRTSGWAAVAGVAAGVAILIRPNLAPLAAPSVVWLLVEGAIARGGDRRAAIRRLAVFLLAVAPGVAAVALINDARYGSPLRSGYGPLSLIYSWSHIVPNLGHYAGWFVQTQTVAPLLGLAALAIPVRQVWSGASGRIPVVAAALFVVILLAIYLPYIVFEEWSFLRFLLPAWPFVMIAAAGALWSIGRAAGRIGTVAVWCVVLGVSGWTVRVAAADAVFSTAHAESKFHVTGRLVAQIVEPASVLLSRQHSGSLRYYAGLMTINFAGLDEEWLDRAVAWLADRGIRSYAVLEEWEVQAFRDRFARANRLGRLAMPPSLIYRGPTTVHVYDLSRSEAPAETLEWPDEVREPECRAPVPKPALVLPPVPR